MGSSEDVWEVRKYVPLSPLPPPPPVPLAFFAQHFLGGSLERKSVERREEVLTDWVGMEFFREPLKNFPPPPSQIKDDALFAEIQSGR
jgi:hypothetical protein